MPCIPIRDEGGVIQIALEIDFMKNFLILTISVIGIVFSVGASAYDDYTVTITPSDISNFYIHTEHHTVETLKNVATLDIKSSKALMPTTDGICDSGFWMDSSTNPAAYSMLLAAIASSNDLNIHYTTQPGPWNNPYYCAIIRVGIN